MAAILPIRPSLVKKFESLMGKFLWKFSGKVLRVALDEVKNVKLAGGLNLPCLASMADSLLASQCIRMLRSGDRRSLGHLDFWVGDLLVAVAPWMGQGVSALETPEYFGHLGQVLASLMIGDTLTSSSVKTLSNKVVYADMTSSEKVVVTMIWSGLGFIALWWRPELGIYSS